MLEYLSRTNPYDTKLAGLSAPSRVQFAKSSPGGSEYRVISPELVSDVLPGCKVTRIPEQKPKVEDCSLHVQLKLTDVCLFVCHRSRGDAVVVSGPTRAAPLQPTPPALLPHTVVR